MQLEITHLFLVPEGNWQSSGKQVERFLERTILVKYSTVELRPETSWPGDHPAFWETLEKGLERNRRTVADLLGELKDEGYAGLGDLQQMEKGYPSKLLHTVCHLLDGFFGIDSFFYNLVEDSHSVSETLARKIRANPSGFWLVEAVGSSQVSGQDPLSSLRTFEPPAEK